MTKLDMAELMNRVKFLDVMKEEIKNDHYRNLKNLDLYHKRMGDAIDFFMRGGARKNKPLNNELTVN